MDFTYDDEQQALRDAVRGLVGSRYSDYEQRRKTAAADPGFDEDLWGRLAEMGVLGLPFSEADGGMGAGPIEVGIVARELGRVLAPEPFIASVVLAGGLVAACGTDAQRQELLGGLAEGDLVLAFAHAEPGRGWTDDAIEVTASANGDAWVLNGTKEPVVAGARADQLIVSAALPDGGTGLFVVSPADAQVRGYPTHDGGRAARVTLAETTAVPLGEVGDRTADIARAHDEARVAACNEAVGLMQTALRTTTAYLTSRKQFGVTLNTFQALTFRAADLYVSLELTASIVDWATMMMAEGAMVEGVKAEGDPAARSDAATRAALQVSRAGRHIGQEAIQLHGGIGMTAEYAIGGYTSRLTALDHWLGDGDFHLSRLASTVSDHTGVDPLDTTTA